MSNGQQHASRGGGRLRRWLSVTAGLTALTVAIGSTASAQTAQASDAAPDVEGVVVTGSRIQVTGMQAPTPVTALSTQVLADIAPGNISQAVVTLPQFYNNTVPATTGPIGTALGATTVNLRGLGPNRTLTLLDGRRMVPFNQIGTVDISAFPSALTQRVDVVTGGASAAYGTDAVAGVVNYVLNTKFTGLDVRLQGGRSGRGDLGNGELSVAAGKQITERLHVLGSVDWNRNDEIKSYKDREWFKSWGLVNEPGNPKNLIIAPNVVSTQYTCGGLISSSNARLNNLDFVENGSGQITTQPFRRSTLSSTTGLGSQSIAPQYGGGSGCDVKAQQTRANAVSVMPGNDRVTGFGYVDYQLTPNTRIYAQSVYAHTWLIANTSSAIMQGTLAGTVYSGNPFLPANIQQIMTQDNVASFTYNRYNTAAVVQNGRVIQTNDTYSGTLGFQTNITEGGFLGGWKVNGYYQYGRNTNDQIIHDSVRIDHLYQALDAVRDPSGRIVCNATLRGAPNYANCVPINLFGPGQASPEALDYVLGPDRSTHSIVIEQDAELTASGKLFDGWAGPIEAALGLDYRKADLNQQLVPRSILDIPVPFNNPAVGIRGIPAGSQGNNQVYQFSTAFPAKGSYNVKEGFAELRIPLLADLPLVQHLDYDGAVRLADYSGSGTIWAWKNGVNWQVTDDVRLRGTESRDVRAATLQERFNNQGAGGAVQDHENNNASYTPTILVGGNPSVNPEKADTWTAGVVYQPSWLRGFSASIDWYHIEVKGAISSLSAQAIEDQCFQGSQQACALIQRDPPSAQFPAGTINRIFANYINVSAFKVNGVDFETGYNRPGRLFGGGDETLNLRLFASYLHTRSTQTSAVTLPDDRAGDIGQGYPRWRGQGVASYSNGPFKVYVREQFIGSGAVGFQYVPAKLAADPTGQTISDNHVPAVWYTDLHFTYSPRRNAGKWEFYFNIDNLFDKDPPVVPGFSAMGGTVPTNTGLYDQVGRRFLGGVHLLF